MSIKGADFSTLGELTGTELEAAGITFVMMYTRVSGEHVDPSAVTDFLDHGVAVGLVHEDGAQWLLGDVTEAIAAIKSQRSAIAECTDKIPHYVAVDFAASTAIQRAAITANVAKIASEVGCPIRPYGDFTVLQWFTGPGWSTPAWSGGKVPTNSVIAQEVAQLSLGGTTLDLDTASSLANGGFIIPEGIDPGQTEVTDVGIDNIVGGKLTPSGKGYLMVGKDGAVFNFGDSIYHGGTNEHPYGPLPEGAEITGFDMNDPNGYILFSNTGSAYVFGGGLEYLGNVPQPDAPTPTPAA